jgi:Na+-driven multidrug efflux pump
MDGEWEVLTLFASFLGPAEVAAWAIYGTICDGYDELIDAIADAFEVRCAYLLGSGLPERAKLSASKGLLVGTSAGILLLSFLFMAGEDLPRWLTNDPVLQHLLKDLLPIFGFSNLVRMIFYS